MNNRLRKLWNWLSSGPSVWAELLENPTVASAILIASLVLTFGAWLISENLHSRRLQDRFDHRVTNVVGAFEDRMLEYEQVLRGGVGLFAASDEVTREDWSNYVSNCQLDRYFPGIQAMGVAVPVATGDRLKLEAQIHAEGFRDFVIQPPGQRDYITAITYIEPFDWRNQRAFGFDMYSNATRREAMDLAIRTGEPAMSGMVTLVQETNEGTQLGWLFYIPIFDEIELARTDRDHSFSERRISLNRFVYAAFRAQDMMDGLLGSEVDDVKFEIYDSGEVEPDSLLYDSDGTPHFLSSDHSQFTSNVSVYVRGRNLTLHFESCPDLFEFVGPNQSMLVACGGLVVDFLLFFVIVMIGRQKRRAVEIASVMTETLHARDVLISGVFANASEAFITIDEDGQVEMTNRAAQDMFGFSPDTYVDFKNNISSRGWKSIKDKLSSVNQSHQLHTVKAFRENGESFVCRLSLGVFVSSGNNHIIVVAHDETDRINSERRIAEINQELVHASRNSGKAELANGVLHNVGNIINSINISTNQIRKQLDQTSVMKLDRICELIAEHEADFGRFVKHDARGQKLPIYLQKLRDTLLDEKHSVDVELHDLVKNVSHIKDVIASQQSEAKHGDTPHLYSPVEVLDDAITANRASLAGNEIEVIKEIQTPLPKALSVKHKILQVLVNLIKNACDSVIECQASAPRITLRIKQYLGSILFEVEDNGIGIAHEVLNKLFCHGFTTKETGHGFGLHSSINAASELGGSLTVFSDGAGRGATFVLSIPAAISDCPTEKLTDTTTHLSQGVNV